MEGQGTHEAPSLREYLEVARRRKWVITQAAILVPLAAVVLSYLQSPTFASSSEVLINRQNIAQTLTGTIDPTASDATRVLGTQVALARIPNVAARAIALAGPTAVGLTPPRFLRITSVTEKTDADVLEFTARAKSQKTVRALATAYARAYVAYRHQLDTASIQRALDDVENQLTKLHDTNQFRSPLYNSLTVKAQQLRTIQTLQSANASVIKIADTAPQISPRPKRNAFLGLMLGLVLGFALAFTREALDTRVRTADNVGRILKVPLLARLPAPSRWLAQQNRLAMLDEPHSQQAEAYRMLRTNFEFFNLDVRARTVLITSPMSSEGKSTTAANLAVALARAGRHVLLVDLDLRRPSIGRFFGLGGMPGVVDVLDGTVPLETIVVTTATGEGDDSADDERGSLHVLPAGRVATNASELLLSSGLTKLIDQLRSLADIVLIDAPPMLNVGDALSLSANVDSILVVVRLNQVRRPALRELHRMLDASLAPTMGFVVTSADEEHDYGYTGYPNYYVDRSSEGRV